MLGFGALFSLAANAQWFIGPPKEDPDNPWKELEVKLPPYPKAGGLIEFQAGGASSNRFFIDPDSISIGGDGVVRYTLVIKGSGGGENVSYEGMRCASREQKYYAFGRRDGTWSTARSGEWRPIEYKDLNRQHGVLFADYFCPDRKVPVRSAQEAINRLRYGVQSATGPGP